MQKLPQTAGIADLRNNHLQVLAMLKQGPVVINSRSQAVAVLVSPKLWDRLANYIEDLEDALDAAKMELQIERGEVEMTTLTAKEVQEWLGEDEKVPA